MTRIPLTPELHAALREAARSSGLSLNEYCSRQLADAGVTTTEGSAREPAAAIVRRALGLLGGRLVGVLAIGSFVRDGAHDGSDVDILIVVDSDVAISRGLYRRWDEDPLTWEGRAVDAHFARLPGSDERISGIWAEAAVDGVVLFDREFTLSRRLGQLRRRILAGEVKRRTVHGQPYWVHESAPQRATF